MLLKSIRIALLVLAAACLSLVYARADALTHSPIPKHPKTDHLYAVTGIVYSQPHNLSGVLFPSSWQEPNGNDADQYVWDNFALQASTGLTITEIRWRGGYQSGSGTVLTFTVAIYPSIAGGTQPSVTLPLVEYQTAGNAGETPAGTYGGTAMYDYDFTLPAPFTASAGTTYWLQLEAWQSGIPDWGIAAGSGGNGQHFRRTTNGSDIFYMLVPGDAAFTLLGPVPEVPISGLHAQNDSPTPLGNVTSLTATVASGSNASYQWSFGDGALGQGQVVTHAYAAAGFYTALITATNSVSSVTATTPITIFSARPLANAGPDQTVGVATKVTLDGSRCFAAPGHWPLIYFWQQAGGTPVVLSSPTISRPTFIAPSAPTVLTFTLVVTDSLGLVSDPDQVRIDVIPTYHIYMPVIIRGP